MTANLVTGTAVPLDGDTMPRPVAHLANLDLNLLVALRERSVTRAAERLGVTQPAASAALSRLRRHFGDEPAAGLPGRSAACRDGRLRCRPPRPRVGGYPS